MWPLLLRGYSQGEPDSGVSASTPAAHRLSYWGSSGTQAQRLPAASCIPFLDPHFPPLWAFLPHPQPQGEQAPFQARLPSRFCMAHLETISASNECFSLCPCPPKCLMNVFCAGVKQGVCPCVSATAVRGAVRLPRPAHWGGGSEELLPSPPWQHTWRPLLCKHRDPGALGRPWAWGLLDRWRMAGVWVPRRSWVLVLP